MLPVLALAVALWLGFDYSPVTAYFMFTLLAITVITQFTLMEHPAFWWILLAAAIVQVVVAAIVWPPSSAGFDQWRHIVFG